MICTQNSSKIIRSALKQTFCLSAFLSALHFFKISISYACVEYKDISTSCITRAFCLLPCTLWLCCLNPALLYSLRCLVFRGVIWSSSSRYGGRPAGAQHPPGHPETQLPVEARHEHLPGCPGAAGWARQGKAADSNLP